MITIFMEIIKTKFIQYVEHQEQTTGYTYSEAQYINNAVNFIFCDVSQGYFKQIFEHGYSGLCVEG